MKMYNFWLQLAVYFVIGLQASASNEASQTFTLDGILYKTGTTTALLDPNATIKVQILNPTGTCVLYEEQQTLSTSSTKGYFSVHIGSNVGSTKRTSNDSGSSMSTIFQNTAAITGISAPGKTCSGGIYTPTAGDVRYFRMIVIPSETMVADTLTPDIVVDSVPQALVAQSVQGLEKSNILQVNTAGSVSLSQTNLEAAFTGSAYTNLQSILAGNFLHTDSSGATLPSYASAPSGLSTGDMWYDSTTNQIKYQSNSGVQTLGTSSGGISSMTTGSAISINGSVAGTVSSGSATIDLSNTGVTAGTYAKVTVDVKGRVTAGSVSLTEAELPVISTAGKVSGNAITSGTISGSTGINTSGNLVTTGTVSGLTVQATNLRVYNGSQYVQLTAQAMSSSISFALPTADGISGQVLSTNGSGVMSWITQSGGAAGTISVGQGGTGTTSYTANRLIASNGTGTALVGTSCSLNQVISFDASGNITCANVSSLASMILNGGNTTSGTISIGSNDNQALQFKTNNTIAMTISQDGSVGIGLTNPTSILHVLPQSSSSSGKSITLSAQSATGFMATGGSVNISAGSSSQAAAGDVNFNTSMGQSVYGNFNFNGGTMKFSGNPSVLGLPTNFLDLRNVASASANQGSTIAFSANRTTGGMTKAGEVGGILTDITNGAYKGSLIFLTADNASPSEKMRIDYLGNVGIGTNSPSSALDISGALTAQGMSSAPAVSASNTGRIYYDYSANKFKVSQNGGAYADLVSASATTGFVNGGNSYGASAVLGTSDNHSLSIKTNNSTAMTISQGGKVGIGTSSPNNRLHLSSGLLEINNSTFSSSPDLANRGGLFLGGFEGEGRIQAYDFISNSFLTFHTEGGGANTTEKMRIDSSGYVGIGTTVPSSILDISGALTAQGMSSAPAVSASNTGRIYYDYSANKFKVSQNGGAYADLVGTGGGLAGTVSVGQGGTNATSFTANRIIASNGTGSALQDFSCSLNQVISFDGSGNATCANVSSLASMILNGGNTTAAAISIGTNDNYPLQIKVNNTVAMTISQGGSVGIGTASPGTGTKLRVDGQIAAKSGSISTGAVDFSGGNAITTSFDCASDISFANLRDGGAYTLAVTGTGTAQCSFDANTTGDDAATVTYRFVPANTTRTASSHTIYSMQRIGTIVYVSWITGF